MGPTYEIILNSPVEDVYRPGNTISGIVKVTNNGGSLWLKNIYVSLEGMCKTIFFARCTHHFTDEPFLVVYYEKELELTLEPGTYDYPFTLSTPLSLPSTFKHSKWLAHYVNIKYEIKVRINTNKLIPFRTVVVPVSFLGYIVPRPMPEGIVEWFETHSLTKTVRNFAIRTKQDIKLKTTLTQNHGKPGSLIKLKFTVINASDVDVKALKTEFVRRISFVNYKYKADPIYKVFKECTVQTPGIARHSEKDFMSTVNVPVGISTTMELTTVEIQYLLRVTVRLPFPHYNAVQIIVIPIGDALQQTENSD